MGDILILQYYNTVTTCSMPRRVTVVHDMRANKQLGYNDFIFGYRDDNI